MKTVKLSFFAVVLFLFACKKEPPIDSGQPAVIMPPLTHTGANTFGCYIDGEPFVAGGGTSIVNLPPLSGSFDEKTRRLNLQGTRYGKPETGDRDYIYMFADIIEFESIYEFQFDNEGKTVGYRSSQTDGCDYNYVDIKPEVGKIAITYLNEEEKIISGTFYMNLTNKKCEGDTLMKITDGRFDFKY